MNIFGILVDPKNHKYSQLHGNYHNCNSHICKNCLYTGIHNISKSVAGYAIMWNYYKHIYTIHRTLPDDNIFVCAGACFVALTQIYF